MPAACQYFRVLGDLFGGIGFALSTAHEITSGLNCAFSARAVGPGVRRWWRWRWDAPGSGAQRIPGADSLSKVSLVRGIDSPGFRLVAAAVLLVMPAMARAQQQGSAPPPATVDPRDAADRRPSVVEPDFTLINLPTTLRLPRFKSAFRISHRFAGTLNNDFESYIAGQAPRAFDTIALNHNGLIADRRLAATVY
jgi:hypothetical protein